MSAPALIETEVETAATDWASEAKRRRGISANDPVADTLEYCAGELKKRLENARAAEKGEWLTVDEYIEAMPEGKRVTAQTVRGWIRRGMLSAKSTSRGYRIRAGTKPIGAIIA